MSIDLPLLAGLRPLESLLQQLDYIAVSLALVTREQYFGFGRSVAAGVTVGDNRKLALALTIGLLAVTALLFWSLQQAASRVDAFS